MQSITIIHKASGQRIPLTKQAWTELGQQSGWLKQAKCDCDCDDCNCDGNCEKGCGCKKCEEINDVD